MLTFTVYTKAMNVCHIFSVSVVEFKLESSFVSGSDTKTNLTPENFTLFQ